MADEDPMPAAMAKMPVYDAEKDIDQVVSLVDFVFCAVNMKKEDIRALEELYARHECPVVSNNSAHRSTPDVPMIIPEINADHADVIQYQRKRLGTKRGFIAVKCNCSLQSYVPLSILSWIWASPKCWLVPTSHSGAGKTFETMPEIWTT